jgi:transcription antitermination factor NusG
MSKKWFAVQVHTGREKWIAAYLEGYGFEQLLLLRRDKRRWSDRVKLIETPIFPGYVFCCFDLEQRGKVLSGPGVMRIVGYGRNATPIEDQEIAALQILHRAPCALEAWPYLREGDYVRIEGGALDGLVGRFARSHTGRRVVVSVTLLQRSVAVDIDRSRLTPVTSSEEFLICQPRVLGSAINVPLNPGA